jgi:hypothetical protein
MESARPDRVRKLPSIEVRMLGPLTIRREGVTLALPASRKVRGLLAYLSLSPRAVARSQLCELHGTSPTTRAENCAGASARSGA